MRAAIISERNAPPVVGDFREPEAVAGSVLIDVDTAGLGGWDVPARQLFLLCQEGCDVHL